MPLFALTGITRDISIILLFSFYQPVFYSTHDQHFHSESEERAAYCVGFGECCDDAMTHKLLVMKARKSSTEVLLGIRNLLLPTMGLHHILEIKFHLDHQWDIHRVPHQNRRPVQTSGPEMMRFHLDPSLCQLLTQKLSLGGHFFCLLKKTG